MKKYAYKNHPFNGYEISVGGTVYKRDAKGALHVITGEEASTQKKLLVEHMKRVRAMPK